jgi:NitT/TauT family transport system substrate-binding protein
MKKKVLSILPQVVIYGMFAVTIILSPNLLMAIEKVVIFSGSSPVFAPGFVADAKGFFKSEGLDVTLRTFTSGADATEGFRSGNAQFLIASDVPFIYLLSGGDSVALAQFSVNRDMLLVMGGPNVKKTSEMKGKKVALVRKSASEYLLHLYLKRGGLTLEDVKLVHLAPFDHVPAITKGDVDGLSTWKPFDLKIQAIGGSKFNILSNCGSEDYLLYSGIATTKKFAKSHPEEVKGVLKALRKACDWLSDASLDESSKLIGNYLKMEPEEAKYVIFTNTWDLMETKKYRKSMKNIEDFLFTRKLISQKIDWSSALGSSFLKEIDPSLVKPED